MHIGIKAIVIIAVLICSGYAWAGDAPDGNKLIRASLLAEYETAQPGQEMLLGIQLEVEEGWHTYWKNSGDSGLPVRVTFDEIEALTFGEMLWPMPEWHLGSGEVLDYVYEGTVVLLVPVTVSDSVEIGTKINVECKVSWLVCKEMCVPGSASLRDTIEIGEHAVATDDIGTLRAAYDALPEQIGRGTSGVRLSWRGAVLDVHCPGADAVTIFLHHSEETAPLGRPALRSVEGDRLRVPFDPAPDQYLVVSGVITVDRGRERGSYSFALPGPEYQ